VFKNGVEAVQVKRRNGPRLLERARPRVTLGSDQGDGAGHGDIGPVLDVLGHRTGFGWRASLPFTLVLTRTGSATARTFGRAGLLLVGLVGLGLIR
jgi:hypothetical protein